MIRAHKVKAVALFEFLSTVKRKGYLIATFGMPLFMLAYIGIITLFTSSSFSKRENEVRVYGVVDQAQVMRLTGETAAPQKDPLADLPEEMRAQLEVTGNKEMLKGALVRGKAVFAPFATKEEAEAAVKAGKIKGFYVIDPQYVDNGDVDGYIKEGTLFDMRGGQEELGDLLVQRMLADHVPANVAARVKKPIDGGKSWAIGIDGKLVERNKGQEVAKFIVPIVFGILMAISIMGTAGYLVQAVATEKENKVVDVLLSSADPDEILTGKLLGLGAAGLLQVVAWFGMAAGGGLATATAMSMSGLAIPWIAILMGFVYFVLGYLLVGALVLGLASLGNTLREAQQMSMAANLLTIVPLILLNSLIADPHGTIARVLTWIPFTSPLTMTIRLAMDPKGVAWWEVAGTLVLVTLTIYASLKAGARLFRVGLLLSGARPKFAQIVKQALASR